MKCLSCGYSKHVEICHIKGISKHDDDTPISKINDLKNLITLCRNHHWELDNGLSSLFELINIQHHDTIIILPSWRNRIAHPTSNREVPGSNPGGGVVKN